MSVQSENGMVFPLYESVPLSRLNTDANEVSERMKQGPVQVMKSSKTFGVLVSREHWNTIAQEMTLIDDLREINELLRQEIEQLKSGEPTEDEEFSVADLKRIANRVSA